MSPSAVPQRPRRLGLTVKDYQFKEPLLQSGPHILKNKSERPPSPEDVNAPPLDFSDEDSSLLLDAELSGMGTPPPPQKSRVTRVRVPKIGNVELGAGLSSRTGGRIASHSGLEPSRIGHTDWKTSEGDLGERSLNEGNKQVKRGSNAIEEKDPFDFMGSQKKPRTSYGGLSNIHASPSSPEKKRSTKKIASTVIKNGKDGFRELNIRDIDALLDKKSSKKEIEGFKDPTRTCDAALRTSKGKRRSARNLRSGKEDGPADNFQNPKSLSPKLRRRDGNVEESHFIVPTIVPAGKASTSTSAIFKVPLGNLPSAIGLSNLTEAEQAAIDALQDPNQPASSLSTSAVPSLSTDVASTASSLSSPPDSPILDATHERLSSFTSGLPSYEPKPHIAHCPVCLTPVFPSLLSSFLESRPRFTVRHQAAFCLSHKRATAQSQWESRGYPDIDWTNFDSRLQKYHAVIEDVLKGRKESYYRNKLEERVKSGRNRTLVQSLIGDGDHEGGDTGYYGSRGARVIMENIITHFSRPLRRLSTQDKLIAASGGVSGYVQAVLVPEVAIALVMDDMRIEDEESARRVLSESAEVGELLCEEEEDVVLMRDREEKEEEEEGEEGDGQVSGGERAQDG